MRSLVSEFFLFVYSTLNQWQALVSGGVVTALVAVFERVSGYHLTKKAYLGLFVGTFLFAAFFLGWREEYRERLRQTAEINKILTVKPRLNGEIQYVQMGEVPDMPLKLGVAMIVAISNVGSIPTTVDGWDCRLEMAVEANNSTYILHGEPRAVPDNFTMARAGNEPLLFGREDALYVKTMRNPISPGAKVVGVLYYTFPLEGLEHLKSSDENLMVIEFKDVLGGKHEASRQYLKECCPRDYKWADIPGMDRPTNVPPPKSK